MQLTSIEFIEFEGSAQQWSIEGLTLGNKNLIVGKNTSGKSRSVNIIGFLSKLVAGVEPPRSTLKYDAKFKENDLEYNYKLSLLNGEVVEETLSINSKIYLNRSHGGIGDIMAESENRFLKFQAPTNTLAVVSRRDTIQHNFLEPLYKWASTLRFYPFSTYLGKDQYAIFTSTGPQVDDTDPNLVVGLFREGVKKYGEPYREAVIADFAEIGYAIEEIAIRTPISFNFRDMMNIPSEPVGIYVKEKELPGITDQFSMSVGMFRVLSLLIQLNYGKFGGERSTIVVDDIGEGLDFDRSCKLINLLRDKAEKQQVQLIMTTNDRFIMNEVPLDEWSVLIRQSNKVSVKNIHNSRDVFEEFKFTGLSNFSFFELEVANAL